MNEKGMIQRMLITYIDNYILT